MLNTALLEKQNIGGEGEDAIGQLHSIMDNVLSTPEVFGSPKEVVAIIESLEYAMQALWKFDRNSAWHTHRWRVNGCSCPSMDNIERSGTPYKYISTTCPFHGNQTQQDEVNDK